ncbi:MAG: hypothetical protein EXS17_01820 [Phycisphaerales bacterium]|nr:hypothetical protein [Phycisphaerales bacterium]
MNTNTTLEVSQELHNGVLSISLRGRLDASARRSAGQPVMKFVFPTLLAMACTSCAHQPSPSALAQQPLVHPQAAPVDFARSWPRTATLHVAQTLRVVLPLQGGTGYCWRVGDPLPACLALTSETTLSSVGAALGAPTEQILTFTATSSGEGDLIFRLMPPGSKTLDAVEIRTTRVLVSAP